MGHSNRAYFAERAADAIRLSLSAGDPWVRAIHRELAWRYEQLACSPATTPIGMLEPAAVLRDCPLPEIIA